MQQTHQPQQPLPTVECIPGPVHMVTAVKLQLHLECSSNASSTGGGSHGGDIQDAEVNEDLVLCVRNLPPDGLCQITLPSGRLL